MVKSREKTPQRRTRPTGWLTTDADEIERRRTRGIHEAIEIEPLTSNHEFFADFQAHSSEEQCYRVEIRSLEEPINSCDCPDHRINGLGTCKHVEATLHWLRRRHGHTAGNAAGDGSPYMELFLDRRDHLVRIRWPRGSRRRTKARELLARHFSDDQRLLGAPLDSLPALLRAIDATPSATRRQIRVSGELNAWLQALDRREQQVRQRRHFETEAARGKASLDLVKQPLYPYQQEGMLHLAFTGRALLADEMGLGKTVQAIAACELLRRTAGIRRVLVISPASLKGEWQEQIAKFTDLPALIVQGPRADRLRQYTAPAFFYLANYEQVRPDVAEINRTLAPDVIVLDEAQRIKNWQTKTATAVKRLQCPYAFVLTGTPIENRIDEIYSIVQFLDPHLFGPLFRFNRDFYQLDEHGRAIGYRNLDRLHQRLQPIMLRRRKEEVEGQLPGRTVNTYFVPMHKEQLLRYREYEANVARLAALARRRPLKKEEMERLQQNLACMRMLCDTPYILDRECRISPKLKELCTLLQEIIEDGDHKIIIFSEWQRMLELVREQVKQLGLGHAWHTGTVPQPKRRAEIRRFKTDPDCRLFLSTDSGSVGLNLQVADVVINLDIPWNPARLEQRIARAWRKHQQRPVQVINLVAEQTIEHRMLALLEQKRAMAAGVVDGKGDPEMALPSGRAAFLERLDSLITGAEPAPPKPPTDPIERLRDRLLTRWGDRLQRLELYETGDRQTLLVVMDRAEETLQDDLERELGELLADQAPRLHLLDRATHAAIQQLVEANLLSTTTNSVRRLHPVPAEPDPEAARQSARLAAARTRLAQGEHQRRMAKLLAGGGFAIEAVAPMREAVDTALHALLHWQGQLDQAAPTMQQIDSLLVKRGLLPEETSSLIARLQECSTAPDAAQAAVLLTQGDALLCRVAALLESAEEGRET